MNLFEKIEAQKTLSPATQNIEGTEGTEGTSPKSLGKQRGQNQTQEGTEGTNSIIILQSDEDDLFFYLLTDIQSGGAYARLWPNIKSYCQRTLDPRQFIQLQKAYDNAKGGQ